MKATKILRCLVVSIGLLVSPSLAAADVVSWTDWTNATTERVNGSLVTESTTVDITFIGPYGFAQTTTGTNYWNPSVPYVSSVVDNAPPAPDIIALIPAGVATVTFSQSVHDPLLALVSWNGNAVDFNTPIEILSFGQGFWGSGTPVLNAEGDGFSGVGEVHGVIRLPGDFTSISFTHTTENWHGFTVGVLGLGGPTEPPVGVPEPATLLLLGTGLVGMGALAWRGSHRD